MDNVIDKIDRTDFKKQLFTAWTSILFNQGLISEDKKKELLKEIIKI